MTPEEIDEALDNLPVVFGLKAQGHLPTIELMLAENHSWKDIGTTIGWDPDTTREHYWNRANMNKPASELVCPRCEKKAACRDRETSDHPGAFECSACNYCFWA